MERTLYITDYDYKRLGLLLDIMNRIPQNRRDDLSCLVTSLRTCKVVAPDEMPGNVVTLNSRIKYFDFKTRQERTVTLVFPSNAGFSEGRISITSHIGAAILGYAEGDIITWKVYSGRKTIRIMEVFCQPEAAGEYHM